MTAGPIAMTGNLKGAFLLSAAALVFTLEVVLMRYAQVHASTGQIVFFRAAAQLAVAVLWVLATDVRHFRTGRPGLQVVRGLASLATWALYYLSFQLLNLALATTLTFTTSLFVVALAAPLLGERVDAFRVWATVIGFLGVVLATGVGAGLLQTGVLVGLASAAIAAVLVFLNRLLVRTEATVTIMFYIGVVTVLGTAPFAALQWQPLPFEGFVLVAATGSLGAFGMWLTIEAYRAGEVSALAPFPYLRIVFAVVAGLALFAEVPDWRTLAGAAVIVGAALAVTRSERRRGLAAPHR